MVKSGPSERYSELARGHQANGKVVGKPVDPRNEARLAADLDLKVDDTASESQQAKDLIELAVDEVEDQPIVPQLSQRVAHEHEESADYQAEGEGVNLNEQQGRNVMITYSSTRRRRTRAMPQRTHMQQVSAAAPAEHLQLNFVDSQAPPSGVSTPSRSQQARLHVRTTSEGEQLETGTATAVPKSSFATKGPGLNPAFDKSTTQQLKIENHFKAQNQNGEAAETEIQPEDTNFDFDQSLCNDLQRILNQRDPEPGPATARTGESAPARASKYNISSGQR